MGISRSAFLIYRVYESLAGSDSIGLGWGQRYCISTSSQMRSMLFVHQPHFEQQNAVAAKSLQSCPTLCNPIDGSPPGSAVPGILQARTLEGVAISFSNA